MQNIIVMVIMIIAILIVPTFSYLATKKTGAKQVLAYMGGDNAGDNVNFIDAVGESKELKVSNWYLENVFGEKKLFTPSLIISTLIIVVLMSTVVGGAF